jgi:hypothetical protein
LTWDCCFIPDMGDVTQLMSIQGRWKTIENKDSNHY